MGGGIRYLVYDRKQEGMTRINQNRDTTLSTAPAPVNQRVITKIGLQIGLQFDCICEPSPAVIEKQY